MAIYKELKLQGDGFAFPLDIKLNTEDWYVRIGAPLHQVVQIRPHLFNPSLFTVNNLYGSSMFNLVADRKSASAWTIWKDGVLQAELHLNGNEVAINEAESGKQFDLSISHSATLSKQEQQLLAAAIMDTWQLVGANANKEFA
jgi:hypothetical protein